MPPTATHDIDDFGVDDYDNLFASSGDEKTKKDTQTNKRKQPDGLGIEEAVAVKKKARVPTVKLDEARLLSDKGIPRLRKKARDLIFKGKGHEFSDAARLLSFYQLWLDDLFPKARFLDALGMIEKTGHKAQMHTARTKWIDEGKPKADVDHENHDNPEEEREPAKFPARVAPIFQNHSRASERPSTPAGDANLFGDAEDIYDATPKAGKATALPSNDSVLRNGAALDHVGNDEPDEDDLDALMAEEAAQHTASTSRSLFGNGGVATRTSKPRVESDDDDVDAMIAEAESEAQTRQDATKSKPPRPLHDEDDLDALMAETEAGGAGYGAKAPSAIESGRSADQDIADAEEEAAMAEMDGLW